MIFGMLNFEEIWHESFTDFVHVTCLLDVATLL